MTEQETDDGAQPMTDEEPASPEPTGQPAPADYSVAVSPRQLAGGLAIVAALVVLLIRSRRRRAKRESD